MLSKEFLNDIQELNKYAELLIQIVKELETTQYFESKIRLQHRFLESLSRLEKLLKIANSKKSEMIALVEYHVDELELTTYFGNRCYTSSLFTGSEKEAADKMLYFIQVVRNVAISLKEEGENQISGKARELLHELKTESKNNLKYLYTKAAEFYEKIYEDDKEKLALMNKKIYLTERQKVRRIDETEFLSKEWCDAMLAL